MRWFLLSLMAVLNCETESESTYFPSYLLNEGSSFNSKLEDKTSRVSEANLHLKYDSLNSYHESLEPGRKKRHLKMEFEKSLNSFHRRFLIPERIPRSIDLSEQNQNLRIKRNVNSSKEKIDKQLRKREEVTATNPNPNNELRFNHDIEVSNTLIDQKPFVIGLPSEPPPHIYKDAVTDKIIINPRTSTNTQTTSMTSDVNLYTNVEYNDNGNTAENVPKIVSNENVEQNSYSLSNPSQDFKLSVDLTSGTVHDTKPPYVEAIADTPHEITVQNNIEVTAPIRPGYPEVILPKEVKTEVIFPKEVKSEGILQKEVKTELIKDSSTPKTPLNKPFPNSKSKDKLPFVTPFHPYTTLFLPSVSSGSTLYHLPLQVPILNLPVNPYFK